MTEDEFRALVAEAVLAPSVHNVQPARWRLAGGAILVGAAREAGLAVSDPEGRDAGLSCGAAVEALVLALSARGRGAEVEDLWPEDRGDLLPGCRMAARVRMTGAVPADPLAGMLARRFTHRGAFGPAEAGGWEREDAVLVSDPGLRARIAEMNDAISLAVLRQAPVRRELLSWMRLRRSHPRWGLDGMSREALRMSPVVALGAGLALGPFWGLFDRLGLTAGLTAERAATVTAPVIAAFHRAEGESPVTSGRAYLRLWLEAAARGMAGWPMAALADDPGMRAEVADLLGIGAGRRLIQVIRFGAPTAPMPARARRPLAEVLV